jgi:hydroxypyruvate reductase
LAAAAAPARVASLILSDVIGSPLEAIASGPTAPDPSTRAEALHILQRYALYDKIPPAVHHLLQHGEETPKPGHPLFARVQNVIIGSNLQAAQAALRQAQAEGLNTHLLRTDLQGEARLAAPALCQSLRANLQGSGQVRPPFCIIAGGETTVTLGINPGHGGRNTELALAAVPELAGQPNALLITLATDGEDGPTDAAGAVVTGDTLHRASQLGLDPADFLTRHDSYTFFETLGDLLRPGATGTNVNDLTFLFAFD